MGCMSNLMGTERQEDGGEMETAGVQTSFYFKVFLFEFDSFIECLLRV